MRCFLRPLALVALFSLVLFVAPSFFIGATWFDCSGCGKEGVGRVGEVDYCGCGRPWACIGGLCASPRYLGTGALIDLPAYKSVAFQFVQTAAATCGLSWLLTALTAIVSVILAYRSKGSPIMQVGASLFAALSLLLFIYGLLSAIGFITSST